MARRFPSSWMDELYLRADIVQIVSGYLPLKKKGGKYWGLCPFHNEKTASFSVDAEKNLYYCFGCHAGGNVVEFLMEMEKLDYHDAVVLLADRMHIPLPQMVEDPDYDRRQSLRARLLEANKLAARYYHDLLWTDQGKPVRDYFYRRGLDDGVIRRFGLGASLDTWGDLTDYLIQQGFSPDELQQAGLTVVKENSRYDFFRGRAMFPILDQQGNVLGFGGRTMGDAQPKYLNTGDTPVFNKRLGVYAVNLLKKARSLSRVLLVEGYMDVVTLSQAGIIGVVATLGTALTQEQARLLKRFAPEIWVAYDGDSAGQHAIERALTIFEQEAIPAKVLYFPDDLDPDEFIRQRGIEAFNALSPMTPIKYRMMRLEQSIDLATQEGRIAFAKQSAELLVKVQDPVEVEVYLRNLSVKTGFDRDVLVAQMGAAFTKYKNQSYDPQQQQRPKRSNSTDAGMPAEQLLVHLLASGSLPKGFVTQDDLINERLKKLAKLLLDGVKPAAILAMLEDNQDRELASMVFSLQSGVDPENALKSAADCKRTIRQEKLRMQIEEKKTAIATVDNPNDKQKLLTEYMKLTSEWNRLKNLGGA